MNFLLWDCRRAGGNSLQALLKDCVRIYKLCFMAILEPRISGTRVDHVVDKFGFDNVVRVEVVGFSNGIWCMWKRNKISIEVLSTSSSCVLLKVNPRSNNP